MQPNERVRPRDDAPPAADTSSEAEPNRQHLPEWVAMHIWDCVAGDVVFLEPVLPWFGIQSSASKCTPNDVYYVWATLIKHDLITTDEFIEAFRQKRLKAFFVENIKKYAVDNLPMWSTVGYFPQLLQQGEHQLQLLNFSTTYDPAVVVPDPYVFRHRHRCKTLADLHDIQAFKDGMVEKDNGNAHFLAQRFEAALACYDDALRCCGGAPFPKYIWGFLSVVYSNRAQAFLNLQRWDRAKRSASTALKFDPTNAKAKHRLGVATEQAAAVTSSKSAPPVVTKPRILCCMDFFFDEHGIGAALTQAGFDPSNFDGTTSHFFAALQQSLAAPLKRPDAVVFYSMEYLSDAQMRLLGQFVAQGGLVIYIGDHPSGQFRLVSDAISWGEKSYFRTQSTLTTLGCRVLPGTEPLHNRMVSSKCVWLKNVPASQCLSTTTEKSESQSLAPVPDDALATPLCNVAVYQTAMPAATTGSTPPARRGMFAFIGDINLESPAVVIIIGVVRLWMQGGMRT